MTEPKISAFSVEFASALRGVMRQYGVTLQALADLTGRSKAFYSERTGGKRPCDTDILDAVATVAQTSTRELVIEIARRMRGDDWRTTDGLD